MKSKKNIVVIILISFAILISYSTPRAKYKGTGFIRELNIPATLKEWQGKDISDAVFVSEDPDTFNFISESVAYQYINPDGKSLLFIIVDAGNFHHPKVCFTQAGYEIREMPDTVFILPDGTLKTHTLFTALGREKFLSFYWIVIDKNLAHAWVEQKFKQLFFSLFGKQRVGLMVRFDIPTTEDKVDEAMVMARQFVADLNSSLSSEQGEFIIGKE